MNTESENNEKSPKSLNILLVGALLFGLAVSSPWFNISIANHSFVKSYFATIGSGILFLITLYYNLNTSHSWRIGPVKITSLLLILFGGLSAFWSVNIDFTITKMFLWLATMFCFMTGLNLSTKRQNLIRFSWLLVYAGSAIALIGIFQYLFDPFTLTQAVAPGSTFGNRNVANQPLILILPFSFYLLFSKLDNKAKEWLIVWLTSLIITFIIYSSSRSAWLSLASEVLLIAGFLFFNKNSVLRNELWNANKRNAVLGGIIFIFILINIPAQYSIGSNSSLELKKNTIESTIASEKVISKNSRYHIWDSAVSMIEDRPFVGSGLGTFSHNVGNEGYTSYQVKGVQRAHNDLLELGVELGIVGLTFFTLFLISICRSIRVICKKSTSEISWFYFVIFTALTGSFVNMQFSFPYQQAMPLVLIGLFLGLIAKQYDTCLGLERITTIKFETTLRKIFFGAWLAIICLIASVNISWINAYDQLNNVNLNKNYSDLSLIDTPITHSSMPSLLSRTSTLYSRNNDYNNSALIDNQILKTWPNHIISLFRLGYGAHKMGKNYEALEYSERLEKLEPEGLYGSYIIKLHVYSSTKRLDDFLRTFNELASKPEHLLAIDTNTYHHLLFFSLKSKKLSKNAPFLYKKYIEYHGFSCEVENNIAIHYFNTKQFHNAAEHVKNALRNNSKCLNPELIKLLKKKNLITKD